MKVTGLIVTSVVLRTQSDSVSAIFVPAVFFHNLLVKYIQSNKKNAQVQQTNVTLFNVKINVSFSTYRPNACKHLSIHQQVSECLMQKRCWLLSKQLRNRCTPASDENLCPPSIFFVSPKICSRWGQVWTVWWIIDICGKSFCPWKMNNSKLFIMGSFQQQRCLLNDVMMTSQWCHCDKTQLVIGIKFPIKCVFHNFLILKIDRITSFCNLFMEWPYYM